MSCHWYHCFIAKKVVNSCIKLFSTNIVLRPLRLCLFKCMDLRNSIVWRSFTDVDITLVMNWYHYGGIVNDNWNLRTKTARMFLLIFFMTILLLPTFLSFIAKVSSNEEKCSYFKGSFFDEDKFTKYYKK